MQFLTEAVMLTFIGGAAGVALGWILSILVSSFAGIALGVRRVRCHRNYFRLLLGKASGKFEFNRST